VESHARLPLSGGKVISIPIPELERDLDPFELRGRRDQRAQGGGSAALPPDDAPEISWGHEQLQQRLAAMRLLGHAHAIGIVSESARYDFDDVARPAHDAGCSTAAASGVAAAGIRATSVRTVSDGWAPAFNQ
jgi:hypothetical protein